MASWAPIRATGRTGTSRDWDSAAAPILKSRMRPSLERVPSGKISTGIPAAISFLVSPRLAPLPLRSTGKALKTSCVNSRLCQAVKK